MNGLSGNKVRNITQLPDGRMIIITEGLLNLYDGTNFSYLHYNQEHICQLSEYSGHLHEYTDAYGHLWLKNQFQLMVADTENECFIEHPDSLLATWGMNKPMKDFFMDKDRNIWIITDNDDLMYIDKENLTTSLFINNVSQIDSVYDPIYDLAVIKEKLYLFYRSGILICHDIKSKEEIYRQQSLTDQLKGMYENTSYVIATNNTFYQIRNGRNGGTMLSYDIEKREWNIVLKTPYTLNYLSVDKDSSIWISCYQGLWNIDPQLEKKQYIPTLKLVDGRKIDTEVSTHYNDNQGGMWVGTLNRGLLYYHPDRFRFENIGHALFPTEENKTIYITCFAELSDGDILVGTRKGLFRYTPYNGVIVPYSKEFENTHCNTLFKDHKELIWIGTSGEGLFCILPDGNTKHYTQLPNTIYGITETPDHTLFIATRGNGFGEFHSETGKYIKQEALLSSYGRSTYQLICHGKDSLIGITEKGWFIYDRKAKKYSFTPGLHACKSIYADKQNKIWIALEDGLSIQDITTGQKETYYSRNGLVNNYIQSIIQTPDNSIWISTSNGITRITETENKDSISYSFANFNQFDGIITDEFCERSVFQATDGTLYWGGINGFNKFSPTHTMINRIHSAPLFVGFSLFGEQIEKNKSYNGNTILKQPITLTKEITLNHDQNFFTLEFSALNYVNPTQTYYRYQLTDIDQTEREVRSSDGRGYASYTDLPSGTYLFRVQAADNNKIWNHEYAEIKITIKAPFWKTPFAYILYFLFIAGGVSIAITGYLRSKRRKLIHEQKEKLDEMKSTFLQNMNQELTTPIDGIIAPLESILKHTDEGKTKIQLKEIQNNAIELKALVNQLSEGVLSPVSNSENELNLEALMYSMRQLLEQQKERKEKLHTTSVDTTNENLMSASDEAFIRKALEYVENNLNNPDYSVELFSRDMGMDRTGLYRKLVSIIGKTPSIFIRSIRLKRAAQLLEQGYTVAEVADQVGFSTSSYLSKCFQEEFGMRPLQYINSLKQANKQ